MVTRVGFSLYDHQGEQNLLQSLVTESIQIHGTDMYYLPRRRQNFDEILGEDDLSEFDTAYLLEFYVESYGGFNGDQSFMSKFGVEIRDQVFFSVAYDRFEQEIGCTEEFSRPREGDLIYFPLNKKCFIIQFVDNKPVFYPTGILPFYRLTCELFELSGETFNTGITDIDDLYQPLSIDLYDHTYTDNDGVPFTDESYNLLLVDDYGLDQPASQNEKITQEAQEIVDFSEGNPFGDIPNP